MMSCIGGDVETVHGTVLRDKLEESIMYNNALKLGLPDLRHGRIVFDRMKLGRYA